MDTAGLRQGAEIPPLALILAAAGLAVLVQGLRLAGPRALPVVRGATTLLGFLLAWAAAVVLGLITTTMLPPPSLTLRKLEGLWLNGYLHWHVLASLGRFFSSFALAVGSAMPLGVLVASVPALFRLFAPLLDFVRMIPATAWHLFAILWLGIGDAPAIFIIGVGIFFPVFLTREGRRRSRALAPEGDWRWPPRSRGSRTAASTCTSGKLAGSGSPSRD